MHFGVLHTALIYKHSQCIAVTLNMVDKVLQISEVASKVLDGLFLNVSQLSNL